MKDLVDNDLSLGDKCYYIHNNKNGWSLAIVEVVEFKAKTLIVKFVDVNPCEEYESKNYHGWYGAGLAVTVKNLGCENRKVKHLFDKE